MPGSAKQTGSHRSSQGSSLSALISTLIPVLLVATIIFVVFLILRKKYPRVYEPRTYLASLRDWQRSPKQSSGLFGWRTQYSQLKDEFVVGHASIDNYLWLRYMRMLAAMCLVGCFITWPVLFPVNATGGGGESGLDILSFSNINPGTRYYAQAFMAWLFLAWVMFMITRESRFFVRLRQQYFLSPYQKARVSTRTVLFTDLPEEARSEEFLRREFRGVRTVWLVNVPEDLADEVADRDTAANKLETGEITLISNYIKRQAKLEKKGEASRDIKLDEKDYPTHRLPILGFLPFGKKVKTVEWSRSELHRQIPEIAQKQSDLRHSRSSKDVQGACFIEFDTVAAAFEAMAIAGSKGKTKMTAKEMGPEPQNIIWKNTVKSASMRKMLSIAGTAFVVWLCLFWTIPVAVIGAIANINYLTNKVPFLSFINDIPPVILGLVTGLLPVILLAVLMALVPIIMGVIAKLFEPTQGAVQMKVQGWYFPFQVIQVFLVTTFASGAAAVATQIIADPTTAAPLLAKNLPKASNFYISYFVLFGLNSAAMLFLNVVPLLFVLILGSILDKTPRKIYNRFVNLGGIGWGSTYPKFTNLGVIALAYSCISPLILGFAAVGFYLLYLGFRYNVLFTIGTTVSTRGESYARGLKQLTVGIYLAEICLIGLFAIGTASSTQATGPLVLMIIFLVVTILWQIWLGRSIKKLSADLPEHGLLGDYTQRNETDPEKAMLSGSTNTPRHGTAGGGIMSRVKGYLHPSPAADNTIISMAENLTTPFRAYTEQEQRDAYVHPAITSECPIVWIAADKYGLSKQEIRDSRKEVGEGLEITDKDAEFNDKGKVEVKTLEGESMREAPIYEDLPAY